MKILLTLFLLISTAAAQDHSHHPPQDQRLHDTFYNSWRMPNGGQPRGSSCCSDRDCYPTAIELREGRYYARRREDGAWIQIPRWKLEHTQEDPRESPDGQSHVCMPPPGHGNGVYCAVLGGGI